MKNLEMDWNLVGNRDSDAFLHHIDCQIIMLSWDFLQVFGLQKHRYWRVIAMILGGKSIAITT